MRRRRGGEWTTSRLSGQRGLAMVAVLTVIFVLTVLSALVLYLSGKEIGLSAVRLLGAQSLNIAEGGAFSGRAAMMALMGADPVGATSVAASLNEPTLAGWYAGGSPAGQNPFGILDYLVLDGQTLSVGATPSTDWVVFYVNWSMTTPRLKLQFTSGGGGLPPADPLNLGSPAVNPLGTGSYRAAVVLTCEDPTGCISRLSFDMYEYSFTYRVVSDGHANPRARRRIILRGQFSTIVRRQNFARYALFTHTHLTPAGQPIWFTSRTSFDGPVHTNGEFRFAFFPKFGTPDSQTPCDLSRVLPTTLTSVGTQAWFNNNGSPRRLAANENVVGGVRRDAPVLPDCTPLDVTDDSGSANATFQRGFDTDPSTPATLDPIVVPPNSYSQKGISIGRDPADVSPVPNVQVRQALPEWANTGSSVPAGIHVPVTDTDGDCLSEDGEPLRGGILVQGNLSSLTFATGGSDADGDGDADLAVYTLVVQGPRTVTITVDRANNRTTVSDSAWPGREANACPPPNNTATAAGPATKIFTGVPKGWQGPGSANAALIYVEGDILSLSGTLEEKEQATVAASGPIDITNHLRYEDPPDVTDPDDNPMNLLGLFSQTRDIRIALGAPNDLVIHAVMMAGTPGPNDPDPGYPSSVHAVNYNTRPVQGQVHLIGGIIEEFYGAFGTFSSSTGNSISGYGRDFRFDRRMGRGFSPPYFPTTTLYELLEGSRPLANVRPVWREGTP